MDQSVNVVELISTLLDSGKYKEALNVPNDEKYVDPFKDNCWDLICNVIRKIQDDTIVTKPSLYNTCEELLLLIIQRAQPAEALLEFIEQLELAKNDAQFVIILNPLQQILNKLPPNIKKGQALEWCLNPISTYIENIPIQEHALEDAERLLTDCDTNVRRITKICTELPPFYQPFIKEITSTSPINVHNKQVVAAFLISLLGKPLIYFDLDPEHNANSEGRKTCENLVQDICLLEKDILKFLTFLDILNRQKNKAKNTEKIDDNDTSPYNQKEKINMTTVSGLMYTVFSDHFNIPEWALPQVYSTDYIVNTVMLSVNHLLTFTEYGPLSKAIVLFKSILNKMLFPVPDSILSSSVHYDVCKNLVTVAIYSSYENIRKSSVQLIGLHINKFDYKGRSMLVKTLFNIANHSGIIGYAITLYKNSIDEALKNENIFPECFSGQQFTGMIKKICHLPYGAESDLMELADQIITALNFLRYIIIRDANNLTGIRESVPFIEKYLSQLWTGLNMSKAHYEVKLKDLEEGKNLPEGQMKVSVNIGGNELDQIPSENKKQIIISALNAFHLIEGLVAQVSECINIDKSRNVL